MEVDGAIPRIGPKKGHVVKVVNQSKGPSISSIDFVVRGHFHPLLKTRIVDLESRRGCPFQFTCALLRTGKTL